MTSISISIPKITRALVLGLLAASLVVPITTGRDVTAQAAGCSLTGSGTDGDPYLVTSGADLWSVIDCQSGSAGVVFLLTQNLDLASANTNSPIGSRCDLIPNDADAFKGVLRGNFKSISNLLFTSIDCGVGLFGALDGAMVENLELSGTFATTKNSSDNDLSAAAALAVLVRGGNGATTISNVSVLANVSGTSAAANTGGLVGAVEILGNLHIADSSVSGTVTGAFSGGLVGTVASGGQLSIFGSTNSADISGTNAAGLVAKYVPVSPPLQIQDSANEGSVTSTGGTNGLAGGAVALQSGQATYLRFENTGEIQAHWAAGAVAKQDSNATYSYIANRGQISASYIAGGVVGVVGLSGGVKMDNSLNVATISGNVFVGGLVGDLTKPWSDGTPNRIRSSTNSGLVSALSAAGGLVGRSGIGLEIQDSENLGHVETQYTNGSFTAGGIVGFTATALAGEKLVILRTTNSGTVETGTESARVGGFIGSLNYPAEISASANLGHVTGKYDVGGFIGYLNSVATISNSVNRGDVTPGVGVNKVGGFVGYGYSGSLWISGSVNDAGISGTQEIGGFVGRSQLPKLTILSSENSGNVSTAVEGYRASVGGFIGAATEGNTLQNLTNSGNVGPADSAGGIAGSIQKLLPGSGNLTNAGIVIGGSHVGGIFGNYSQVAGISLSTLQNTGTVSATATSVGGIFGQFSGADYGNLAQWTYEFSHFENQAEITGGGWTGGIVGTVGLGTNQGVSFSSLINGGNVGAQGDRVGGIVGVFLDTDGDGTPNSATISKVVNFGTVTGFANTSGIVGYSNLQGTLGFSQAANFGIVSGTSKTSGLLGSHDLNQGTVAIIDSLNSGAINGGTGEASGLAVALNGNINNFYNVGEISSSGTTSPVYSSGTATGNATIFALSDWDFGTASSQAELMEVTTFTNSGWNFTDVWGLDCGLNTGFPVLRWIYGTSTFSDTVCLILQVPQVSPGSQNSQPSYAPVYLGPILDSSKISVSRLEKVEITGSRLSSIVAAEIDGYVLNILALSSSSMTITIPASVSDGVHDLVVLSSFGRLTVLQKLHVIRPLASESFGTLIGYRFSEKFLGNSRSLSGLQEAGIEKAMGDFPTITTIVCWGYTTSSNPNDWALAHATARANSICSQVQALRSDVTVYVRVRSGLPKAAAMRASMQFWRSEKTD